MTISNKPGWIDLQYSDVMEELLNDLFKNKLKPEMTA